MHWFEIAHLNLKHQILNDDRSVFSQSSEPGFDIWILTRTIFASSGYIAIGDLQRGVSMFSKIKFASFLLIPLFYFNCAKVQMTPVETSVANSAGVVNENPQDPEVVYANCDSAKSAGKLIHKQLQVVFDNQGKTCHWGANGNLPILNGYVRARTENVQTLDLPVDAKVCQVKMTHKENTQFIYDDNILITLNNVLMAATTDFEKHFSSKNGIYKYDWNQLVDKLGQLSASDSAPSLQYCFGKSKGLSDCLFPPTETVGNIRLNFNERAIQEALAATVQNKIQIAVITTGDNDNTDCLHTPMTMIVDVDYYK